MPIARLSPPLRASLSRGASHSTVWTRSRAEVGRLGVAALSIVLLCGACGDAGGAEGTVDTGGGDADAGSVDDASTAPDGSEADADSSDTDVTEHNADAPEVDAEGDAVSADAGEDVDAGDDADLDGSDAAFDAVSDAETDAETDAAADAGLDAESDVALDADTSVGPPSVVRGRFESNGPVRTCGGVATSNGPDGHLIRVTMDLCGDDIEALAATIVANLDHLAETDRRGLLVIAQGTNLPSSWLAECDTWTLDDPNFSGDLCLPWDAAYQSRLESALVDVIGPAVEGHPALRGAYFTTTTMTNGVEMHFRVAREGFTAYPGDAVFQQSYFDQMDVWQRAFDVPILFEAGHCIWLATPVTPDAPLDCDTPRALYEHTRDTWGVEQVGIALWNCAERFVADPDERESSAVTALLEQAGEDGASIGCQTVGSFTNGACRFTDADVADYGSTAGRDRDRCAPSDTFDPEAACVDTMSWFAGLLNLSDHSPVVRGTWSENWSADLAPAGVYSASAACAAAIDRFAADAPAD